MSLLHELALSQPLSLTITLSHLSGIKVNGHHAQEQEDSLKIGQSNTTPTKQPQQAPRPLDSDDKNSDFGFDNIDNVTNFNPSSKSDASHRNCTFNQGGDGFSGDIKDTPTRDNSNNDSFSGDIEDSPTCDNGNNASSSADGDTTYNPGSINFSSNNITSGSLGDSSSHDRCTRSNTRHSDDCGAANNSDHSSSDHNHTYNPGGICSDNFNSGNNTPHTPFPFDNDATDSHHSDDCRHDSELGTTDNSLGLINSPIVYDHSGISFSHDSTLSSSTQDGNNTLYDPSGFSISDDCNLVYDPSSHHFDGNSNRGHIKSNASTSNLFYAANASHKHERSATHSHFYAMCHIDPL